MRLLVAEDSAKLLKALTRVLQSEGYAVDGVTNGEAALEYLSVSEYDGVVLDIMMPKKDGLQVLREMRKSGNNCPVMFLTALSDIPRRVEGLEAGADDYLSKPFDMSEFLARVHAMLRRRGTFSPRIMSFAGVELSCASRKISYKEQSVGLGGKEFQIMELLMGQPGTIVPIDTVIKHAWNWDNKVDSSVVWVQVSNLRKKIAKIEAPITLRFERGAGYILEELA